MWLWYVKNILYIVELVGWLGERRSFPPSPHVHSAVSVRLYATAEGGGERSEPPQCAGGVTELTRPRPHRFPFPSGADGSGAG